ncbi:hypothetical protein HDK77DRAFT_102166 [Phyllosticta capitalensis]
MGKRVLSHLFASERHFGKADDARACVFVVAVVWFGSRQLVACANVGGLRSSDCDEGCEEANEKSDLHLRKSVCFLEGILILIRCLATSRPSVPRLLLYTIRLCQITSNSRVAPYCIHRVPTCCATSAKSPEICQSVGTKLSPHAYLQRALAGDSFCGLRVSVHFKDFGFGSAARGEEAQTNEATRGPALHDINWEEKPASQTLPHRVL